MTNIKNLLKHFEHDQDGFFTMMLSILLIIVTIIVLAYIRVAHAHK